MKISASIYANPGIGLVETIKQLDKHGVDLLHVDCNDDPIVFEDVRTIRDVSNTPVDLHIIAVDPSQYFEPLHEIPVEYVTFQHEKLRETIVLPENFTGSLGIAFTSDSDIDAFEQYSDIADFIMFTTKSPGKSGSPFDQRNIERISAFKQKFPGKHIHVDGGMNAQLSPILRNLGVYAAVSGSYLFREKSIEVALMNLKATEKEEL